MNTFNCESKISTIQVTMSLKAKARFLSDEIGLTTILKSQRDVYLIILLRMIRLLGFGATSLILVFFLKELNVHEQAIGFFMTLTFVGDLVTSFLLSMVADKVGRRFIMVFTSFAMTATGVIFAFVDNYYVLSIVAVVGILTPGGSEVGPFRSIEQSSIASLAPHNERSDIYAWYTFLGTFCAALGSVVCGALIDFTSVELNFTLLSSYKIAFLAYAFLSLLSVLLSLLLSDKIECKDNSNKSKMPSNDNDENNETSQLLSSAAESSAREALTVKKKKLNFLPDLDLSVYSIVFKLSILFAVDSFASSLVSNSWQTYYIEQKFSISPSFLGSIFFTTGIVSGVMSLLGTTLTKRLGPVVTMVVTHLPASILLALVPLPRSLVITLGILIVRASTQTMDVAPKHVFLATLVPDKDRTAVFGWVNVVKTLAQVVGPTIVGGLTNRNLQYLTFIIAGSLKATYDVGILATFLTYNRHSQH